jgi:hypothetical protein
LRRQSAPLVQVAHFRLDSLIVSTYEKYRTIRKRRYPLQFLFQLMNVVRFQRRSGWNHLRSATSKITQLKHVRLVVANQNILDFKIAMAFVNNVILMGERT